MNTLSSSSSFPRDRALVLGGGGSAGNAWLIGVLAGLSDAGLEVTDADLVIGTSAGATAAAQITNAPLAALYAAILDALPPERPLGRRPVSPLSDHLERTNQIIAASHDLADLRRRVGAEALEVDAASDGSASSQWRATTVSRLPEARWPEARRPEAWRPGTRLLLTAVDARTGEPVEFDGDSGIDLVDAVAASTSGGPSPYRIGDARYIDGGYRRSSENADLAAGAARVLVLSPLGGRTRHPLHWGSALAVQVDELRASGSRVETILPDAASRAAFGDSMMNPSTRIPAARAGHAQGFALADTVTAFWN